VRGWTDELIGLTGAERQKIAAFLRRKASELTGQASEALARLAAAPEESDDAAEPKAA
jgi:hypothetical protein